MRRSVAKQLAVLLGMVMLGLLSSDPVNAQSPPKLHYGFQGGHKYAYQVKIVATLQECEITHEGILSFDVLPKDIPAVREALRALGPAAEGATIPWLKDRETRIREEARSLLKEFGGRASIAALEEASSQARGFEHDRIRDAIGAIRIRVPSQGPDSSATSKSHAAAASGMRTWQDASGTYTIEAVMVSSNGTSVTLKKKDGRTVTVSLENLSAQDQAWVKTHAKPAPPNPFE